MIPTFKEVMFRAKRQKCRIVAEVLMGDDSICLIEFGPRGGWRRVAQ